MTFGMVLAGFSMSSAFSPMNLAPPQAKLSRATPVKKFMGPLGMVLAALMARVLQSTLGRPKPMKRNRLIIRNATIRFWTMAVVFRPTMLTMVQAVSAIMATSVSLNWGKMEQK